MRGSLPGEGARKGGKGGGEAAGPPAKRAAAGEGSAAEGAGEMEVVVPMAAGFDI